MCYAVAPAIKYRQLRCDDLLEWCSNQMWCEAHRMLTEAESICWELAHKSLANQYQALMLSLKRSIFWVKACIPTLTPVINCKVCISLTQKKHSELKRHCSGGWLNVVKPIYSTCMYVKSHSSLIISHIWVSPSCIALWSVQWLLYWGWTIYGQAPPVYWVRKSLYTGYLQLIIKT